MKNKNTNIQIGKSWLIGIFLQITLFASIRPQFFNGIPGINGLYLFILLASTLLALAIYLRNIRLFKFAHAVSLYYLAFLLPTILYSLSLDTFGFFVKTYAPIWAIVIFAEYYIIQKKGTKLLKRISALTLILVIINIISIITNTLGATNPRNSFLGYDNTVLPFILFGALVAYVSPYLVEENKKESFKWLSRANLIAIFINCAIVESANAKIAIIMIAIMVALDLAHIYQNNHFKKLLNLKIYTIISIIIFFAIVVFRLQYLFEDFIVNDLHRNLTITGRTEIWNLVLRSVEKHPLIGIGIENFSTRAKSEEAVFHAHSTYLNILYEGGIIGLMLYLNIFRTIWKKIKNENDQRQVAILSFITLIYFVITVIEFYKNLQTFYIVLTLLYYSPELRITKKKEKIK